MNRPRPLLRLLMLALLPVLGACAGITRNAVPTELANEAQPLGIPGLRVWGDVLEPNALDALVARQAGILRTRYGAQAAAGQMPVLHYLALSGGGPDGAFGAGVLKAWSQSGTRPQFAAVAGVSTGAIIAPFAFLGSDYDPVIEEIYTTLRTSQVARSTVLSGLVSGVALTDTTGLANRIAHYVDAALLAKVAAEYRRGRLLFVGTTNLDYGRPMIWNMGAIAASGHAGAVQLFRDVIRASAAVPIAFPPVFIPVQTADGRRFDEMHVDGGATSQVVLISPQVPIAALTRQQIGRNIDRRMWVIVNNRVLTDHAPVRPRIFSVGGASISALIRGSAIGDLYKLFLIAERDEVEFRAAWIPRQVPCTATEEFDPVYMRCLFDFGAAEQRRGALWSDLPPYFVRPPLSPMRVGNATN
ncbi:MULTISPECIES: patatin-like phospholipase family protein [Roseomonadaceae]|uniref:Patatin-like phospholipase family protein n=1 Tax=Falsiroseomonas oleicola TaxID=2801474 RepID=A0ABS6H8P5_9PROT|nr:patatin-like phospholipase family protein [Roseomonas oleicola]MBU8545077.1 patatin-like phospholipase family protein [Roseomonas oleicola]